MLAADLVDDLRPKLAKFDDRGLEFSREITGDIVDAPGDRLHGLGNDAEAARGPAGVGRLNRRVDREDLGLFSNLTDLPDLRISNRRNVVREDDDALGLSHYPTSVRAGDCVRHVRDPAVDQRRTSQTNSRLDHECLLPSYLSHRQISFSTIATAVAHLDR